MEYIFTADLGTVNDYTAYSLVQHFHEKQEGLAVNGTVAKKLSTEDRYISRYNLTYLERVPLGTTYPDQVADIKQKLENPQLQGRTTLLVDMTGVGVAIYQMMREVKLEPVGITITGGLQAKKTEYGYTVPKKDLVSAFQLAFQTRRLKIADALPFKEEFVEEIRNFKLRITRAGNETYEAWRDSVHDDLMLSVAISMWYCMHVLGNEYLPYKTDRPKQESWDPLRHNL